MQRRLYLRTGTPTAAMYLWKSHAPTHPGVFVFGRCRRDNGARSSEKERIVPRPDITLHATAEIERASADRGLQAVYSQNILLFT
jgi:hypothetical protein